MNPQCKQVLSQAYYRLFPIRQNLNQNPNSNDFDDLAEVEKALMECYDEFPMQTISFAFLLSFTIRQNLLNVIN